MSGWNPSGEYTPDETPTRKVDARDIRVGDVILDRGSEFWGPDRPFPVERLKGRTAYYGDPRTAHYGFYYLEGELEVIACT